MQYELSAIDQLNWTSTIENSPLPVQAAPRVQQDNRPLVCSPPMASLPIGTLSFYHKLLNVGWNQEKPAPRLSRLESAQNRKRRKGILQAKRKDLPRVHRHLQQLITLPVVSGGLLSATPTVTSCFEVMHLRTQPLPLVGPHGSMGRKFIATNNRARRRLLIHQKRRHTPVTKGNTYSATTAGPSSNTLSSAVCSMRQPMAEARAKRKGILEQKRQQRHSKKPKAT